MSKPFRSVEGLVVPISIGSYRKERAAFDGLYCWDRESQSIILSQLGEFLPKVRETRESGIFSLVVDGKEACGSSIPLGRTKFPTETFGRVEAGLDGLRRQLERDDLTPEARLILEKFALPDPDRLPEFYRTFTRNKEPQLLIIWGCNLSESDFIPPADALAKLPHESGLGRFLRKALPFLLALLLLAIITALVWLYLALPVVELALSKDSAAPHEPIRASIKSVKGETFSFSSSQANVIASQPDGRLVNGQIRDWELESPVEAIDLSFPESGKYEIKVTGRSRVFGFALPPVSTKRAVNVTAADKTPGVSEHSQPTKDSSVLAAGQQITIKLLSEQGVIPAQISVTSSNPGSLQFAGTETKIADSGVPVNLPLVGKPGVYRAKFTAKDGAEEQHFIKIAEAGDSPLIANVRASKAEVGIHENLLFDASSSMEEDPEARIVSKEISLDGGNTFEPMKGNFHVTSFSEPGGKNVVLKIKDDKGREATDSTEVKVAASEPPKPVQLTSGKLSKKDIEAGALYSIPEGILFEPGRADISPQGQQLLAEFAKFVAGENVMLSVVGYTDDVPVSKALQSRFADNQQLSEARAQSALALLAAGGIKNENLRAEGKGESAPLAPNTSDAGRAKNRRIEISIIPAGN